MAKISSRERNVLIMGAVALIVMTASLLLRGPMNEYAKSKEWVKEAEANLRHAKTLEATYQGLLEGNQAAADSLPEVSPRSLVSIINDAEQKTNLSGTKKVQFENATTSIRVEDAATNRARLAENLETFRVTLRGMSVEELVSWMHAVHEGAGILLVESVNHLRPASDGQGLDCQMVISKVVPNRPA